MVAARGRGHQRLDRLRVAGHVGEVAGVLDRFGRGLAHNRLEDARPAVEGAAVPLDRLAQPRDGDDPHPGDELGLLAVAHRHHDRVAPGVPSREHRGQHAVDRSQPPVEGELAQVHDALDRAAVHAIGRAEARERDGQVER
ncbi:hypothetical protein GCM10025877_01500 [Agromyces mangrovi Wang et al. 2018]|nr:hypothetical protein GCM10025877_01500 [Agromyces mangrovi]